MGNDEIALLKKDMEDLRRALAYVFLVMGRLDRRLPVERIDKPLNRGHLVLVPEKPSDLGDDGSV